MNHRRSDSGDGDAARDIKIVRRQWDAQGAGLRSVQIQSELHFLGIEGGNQRARTHHTQHHVIDAIVDDHQIRRYTTKLHRHFDRSLGIAMACQPQANGDD